MNMLTEHESNPVTDNHITLSEGCDLQGSFDTFMGVLGICVVCMLDVLKTNQDIMRYKYSIKKTTPWTCVQQLG